MSVDFSGCLWTLKDFWGFFWTPRDVCEYLRTRAGFLWTLVAPAAQTPPPVSLLGLSVPE